MSLILPCVCLVCAVLGLFWLLGIEPWDEVPHV